MRAILNLLSGGVWFCLWIGWAGQVPLQAQALDDSSLPAVWPQYSPEPVLPAVQKSIWEASQIGEIPLPDGFERVAVDEASFAHYLRHFRLKPDTTIYLHNGQRKPDQSFGFRVLDIDVGSQNLQQCADAVIRLRAEYLYQSQAHDQIRFNFTNGQPAVYQQWREGYRAYEQRGQIVWRKEVDYDGSYPNFRKYLDLVFYYAGTFSLERELITVPLGAPPQIGDVLIRGGFPGHAMLLVDLAQNPQTGEYIFLLMQSARPAQDMHLVRNRNTPTLSPWYSLTELNPKIQIEEWTFDRSNLKRFAGE
ncbi:DUF4846 domain-containing protein [Eisenibacter elegans]|uniref:DUF4846 domain-containing protein n=1 Tax=Eisenibacter elegans TaxID=997 RepID=UPI0009D6BA4C|nr:DUF4846 domain-containing protein [Eisenibacter elegans]